MAAGSGARGVPLSEVSVRTIAAGAAERAEWDHVADLSGRRQAFHIVRRRTVLKSGRTAEETVHGFASLPPERAGPAEMLALVRGHWEIENGGHYVRDFAFDKDRSRIGAGVSLASDANACSRCVGDRSEPSSEDRRSALPSTATTSPSRSSTS